MTDSNTTHGVPDNILKVMALRHQPVVFLHSTERYLPCSIEYFFRHSTYTRNGTPLYPKGAIKPSTLPSDAARGDSLVVDEKYYGGQGFLTTTPMYAYPRETTTEDGARVIQISYCFLYTYNGPKQIFGCIPVGEHQGDVEHITIELCGITYQPRRVYFGAHKSDDGMWVDPAECEYTPDNRLVVYSARDSHASYPNARDYNRCIGCADDITDRGHRWFGPLVIIDDTTEWNMWPGHLGTEPTPGHHGWWDEDTETSTSWWKRMFCICR